ncbi:acireductone dioxygenase apoprotein [Cyanobacterium stanieri PCC 7202]|uniref:Acireductone dioxygenase n=1 Tax=Cyanobacterium stanieri (strain ATCC 29140 / PCC 7202) TaxID=292563 RepID=K9YKR5_CYASC|nr:acireductone dioxygenase apoprotein [Cyanobacterium stanieri PCC 7202]
MTSLKIFDENNPTVPIFDSQEVTNHREKMDKIVYHLNQVGVKFEQWQTKNEIRLGATQEDVLKAYDGDVQRLIQEAGYQAVDVVSLTSDNPQKDAFREKFLNEHTHSEDEVRFFVAGEGLFSLHLDNRVFEVLCTKGDLISVPANTPHWFDMGPNPNFIAIRLFNNPEGWVANFTGSDIASKFSRLEN